MDNSQNTFFFETLNNSEINIGENSNTTILALLNKGWENNKTIKINFKGNNSILNFIVLIIGTKKNSFSFETISNHEKSNTSGNLKIRSVMLDESKIKYRGNILVKPGSENTNSHLEHHSLLLSRNARIEKIPCLEIENNDVTASHAATIGQMDEDIIFYLESRGLSEKTTKNILVKSFLETDITQISNENTKTFLKNVKF